MVNALTVGSSVGISKTSQLVMFRCVHFDCALTFVDGEM